MSKLEYFNENPEGMPDSVGKTISQLVFEKRVRMASIIDNTTQDKLDEHHQKIRDYHIDLLHYQVEGMNLDNFIVRPKRKHLEPFLKREYWQSINDEKYTALEQHISTLPTEADSFNEDEQSNDFANRFDNLMLTMQLDLLEKGLVSEGTRVRVMETAQQLEGKTSIPIVANHLPLIQIVQTMEFWQNIDLSSLEQVRRVFRNLMFALDKAEKSIVYTDFEDEMLSIREVTGEYRAHDIDLAEYRKKAELFIREHEDHLTIQKIKRNKPITQIDLNTLEELLIKASGMDNEELYRDQVYRINH